MFGGVNRFYLFKLGWDVETDLRAIMYEHLTRLSFSYYDRTQSGDVISRANRRHPVVAGCCWRSDRSSA